MVIHEHNPLMYGRPPGGLFSQLSHPVYLGQALNKPVSSLDAALAVTNRLLQSFKVAS